MILTGSKLRVAAGRVLSPAPESRGPISVDVHVEEGFTIEPGDFHVASTAEGIEMPNHLAAKVTGRSSHMRRGIYMPGGWVDPGYESSDDEPFVLEFFNMSDEPQPIGGGEAGARLVFHELGAPTDGYRGRWQG